MGIIRPKIYLPYNMDAQDLSHVVAHEQAHIRRRDHWWKPLGFLLLTIHWFNPLMWLAYVLLCRDIELACDEKVIKELGNEQRADYTQALVACSVGRRMIAACPLAFGEVGVKERVKSVMNYKKPAFWVIVLAVIACVVVAVCFLTDPKNDDPDALPLLHSHSYGVVEVTYETAGLGFSMVAQQNTPVYAISESMQLMSKGEHSSDDEWVALGTLAETELTSGNFDTLFAGNGNWFGQETASSIRKNTVNAWTLVYNQDVLYYVLQQKNGDVYLAHGYYDYSEKNDPAFDDTNIRWLFKLAYDLSEDTGIIAASGESVIPVVVFPSDTPVGDLKDSIHWLDIAPGIEDTVPFTILCDGKEQYGFYSVYDAKTLEPLDFVRPSGLAPQTYLFQNAEYGHEYIVIMRHSLGGADLLCFGARIGNVYHNKLLSVKIEEIGADETVEATYNYFDIAPFESVTLPGVHTAIFSIEEVGEYVHISFEQPLYHNEQELRELQMRLGEMLHLTTAPDGGTAYTFSFVGKSDPLFAPSVREWFNYLDEPDEMNWSGRLEINLPEFPDVTFRWYPEKMEAVTDEGITPLYTGMPIWNTYFCDLTGDGLPDLCSTYTFGSSMIDSRIIIYDYANGASYELIDRGNHDFTLRFDKENGRLWVDKKVYNSDELVSSGYLVFADGCLQVAEDSSDSLDAAISNAILDHYRRDEPDGLIHVESHVLLANETISGTPQLGADNHMEKTTVYLLVFHEKYSTYGEELESVGGSYVPAALTFTISDSGEYILEEYWEPRDGGYYVDDVRDKFPGTSADDALNDQAYIEDLEAQNYSKALAYLNSTGSLDVRIAELLDGICSSPGTYASDPDKYLEGHEAEYQELLGYGEYTLRYCFSEFLQSGQTDLHGQIMALACQDIMLAWGEGYAIDQDPITGQDWFNNFRSNAESLSQQYSNEDLERFYPGSYLLLELN